jgi:predicted lipoprotein
MSHTGEKRHNSLPGAWKWALWALLLCAFGVFLYRFPPFRFVPLDAAKQQRQKEAFDAAAFAEDFWSNRLMKSLDQAADASALVTAIRRDPGDAKKKYSRTWGMGSLYYYYFVAGTGRVVTIHSDAAGLSLNGLGSDFDISIATANIFGNAIRNGTGLLDPNNFANSQDLNNISLEINRIVETRVLPPFREKVSLGSDVKFVGCVEIMDEEADLHPIRIIPILLEIQ